MIIKGKMPKGVTFAMLPEATILDQRLAPMDLRVMAYLLCKTPGWKVYTKQVAKVLHVSDRTVRRSIERLQEAGYAARMIDRYGGFVRYPDILIKSIPAVQSVPVAPDSGVSSGGDGGKLVQAGGLVCPDESTPLTTEADKPVHKAADSDDRLTQKDSFTQKGITQTQITQTDSTQSDLLTVGGESANTKLPINDVSGLLRLAEEARRERLMATAAYQPPSSMANQEAVNLSPLGGPDDPPW